MFEPNHRKQIIKGAFTMGLPLLRSRSFGIVSSLETSPQTNRKNISNLCFSQSKYLRKVICR